MLLGTLTLFQLSSSPWFCSPGRSQLPSPMAQRRGGEEQGRGGRAGKVSQRSGEGWVLAAGRRRIARIPANLSSPGRGTQQQQQQQPAAAPRLGSEEALTPSPLPARGSLRAGRQRERGIHPKAKQRRAASLPP